MFKGPFRRKLIEHNWLSINEEDTNPTQQWNRIKMQAIRTLRDLALLSDKLPLEKRNELFTNENISPLINSITKLTKDENTGNILQYPNMDMVFNLVDQGIEVILERYRVMSFDSPNLAQITIDQLQRARGICQDIVNISRNEKLENETKNENIHYLFTWNEIKSRDLRRFTKFIYNFIEKEDNGRLMKKFNVMRYSYFENIDFKDQKSKLVVTIFDQIDNTVIGQVYLVLDSENSKCDLRITVRNEVANEKLIAKEIGEEVLLYTSKKKYSIK